MIGQWGPPSVADVATWLTESAARLLAKAHAEPERDRSMCQAAMAQILEEYALKLEDLTEDRDFWDSVRHSGTKSERLASRAHDKLRADLAWMTEQRQYATDHNGHQYEEFKRTFAVLLADNDRIESDLAAARAALRDIVEAVSPYELGEEVETAIEAARKLVAT